MQSSRRDTDDPNTEASMHEGFIEVSALEGWHAAILACFPIKDEVGNDESAADDGCTVEQPLAQVAGTW